jgi:hypothetical protein
MTSAIDTIRSCKYLFLETISEPEGNKLRVVILEATTGEPLSKEQAAAELDPVLRTLLPGSCAIEPRTGCKRFELFWESYVGYSVINERTSTCRVREVKIPRLLVTGELRHCRPPGSLQALGNPLPGSHC